MSHKTIVALYDDRADAQRAADDLNAAGFGRDEVSIEGGSLGTAAAGGTGAGFNADPGLAGSGLAGSSLTGSSWAGDYSSGGGRLSSLTRLGVPQNDAEIYAEGVRRGGSLLIARIGDARVDEALAIIERHSPVDLEHRGSAYREAGWSGYDATLGDYDEVQVGEERARYGSGLGAAAAGLRDVDAGRVSTDRVASDRDEVIPVAEEHLHVGKRAVERGRVRVRSYVVETPVEETVTLRDETVSVERRAVDRPLGEVPADAFRERSIEVTETDEQAVVAKEARVTEELVVRKEVATETETVRDTVRRTEVEIEDDRNRIDGAEGTRRTDIDRTDI
jgi:uncharacterized protein (TIGR02271 family)